MELGYLGAGLAIGIACIGVAIGQGFLIFKTMDTIGKNPKLITFLLTLTILGIALLESSAIYGLLVAFEILGTTFTDPLIGVAAGLSIGLCGFGVGIGEGILISKAIEAINLNPDYKNKLMAYMILYVALIESSAIYGLVISLQILNTANIDGVLALTGALAIGLTGLGVPIAEGFLGAKTMYELGDEPKNARILLPFSILGIALVESAAIYGLIIAIQAMGADAGFGAIGAALAIGIAGIGVALGESFLLQKAIPILANDSTKSRTMIPMAVLGVALVESAAIYALVIAMQILHTPNVGFLGIGAGIAIGCAGFGVAIGEGILVAKAIETAGIKRVAPKKIITHMILFVALVESAAIYGFIIAIQILSSNLVDSFSALGVALAIGLAGLGVGVGEGILSARSIAISGRRPQYAGYFLTTTILGVALVESAAIYGFIVSIQILQNPAIIGMSALGAGLAIGFAALGAGFAEGYLVSGAFKAMARNPNNRAKDLTLMILFLALVEVLAIYGLFIATKLIGV